ncbi:MFS transporter [Nocardioides donggukensis]|uniref:MFS transporter n=1 Tax=Nocardioides donggukensis TaxID=2774019 RepID=A0A927K4C6_9ACTN|nr:MFS transporter [Nocardioides donggukensis]MBD8868643.1 MFS transporter [Nocardioides donggukensis]
MSLTTPAPSHGAEEQRATRMGPAVLALATGGFAIGTTEFVSMGLLPQLADGVGVSISSAGHVISAYALGVVVGAPVLAFLGARLPRRALLLALMSAFALGNAASALAGGYGELVLARFLAGLPHGAYFGVASLVAAGLAAPGRKGRAVALVMLGLSVANVVGVPAATWLGQHLGWRSAYWAVTVLGALTMALVARYVPAVPGDPEARGRRELGALAVPQVWLTLGAGAVGFGGMFAVYTYIAPTVTEVGGLPESAVPVFLFALGVGMVLGTWVAGELADRSVFGSLLGSALGMAVVLLLFAAVAPLGWIALPVVTLITVLGSVLVVNLQLRLMEVAGDAQTLGAAMNHASLNVANALGAWLGGLVIAAGWGYRSPALVGAALSLLGLAVLSVSAVLDRRARRA